MTIHDVFNVIISSLYDSRVRNATDSDPYPYELCSEWTYKPSMLYL